MAEEWAAGPADAAVTSLPFLDLARGLGMGRGCDLSSSFVFSAGVGGGACPPLEAGVLDILRCTLAATAG